MVPLFVEIEYAFCVNCNIKIWVSIFVSTTEERNLAHTTTDTIRALVISFDQTRYYASKLLYI